MFHHVNVWFIFGTYSRYLSEVQGLWRWKMCRQARPRSGSNSDMFGAGEVRLKMKDGKPEVCLARCILGDWRACHRNGGKFHSSIGPWKCSRGDPTLQQMDGFWLVESFLGNSSAEVVAFWKSLLWTWTLATSFCLSYCSVCKSMKCADWWKS